MEGLEERNGTGENAVVENAGKKAGRWHVEREYMGCSSPGEALEQVIAAHFNICAVSQGRQNGGSSEWSKSEIFTT